MPPPCRNSRLPTGSDTPQASAASAVLNPSAILRQNSRTISRRTGGRPGERIAGRPDVVSIHPAERPIEHPLDLRVLLPPVEPSLSSLEEKVFPIFATHRPGTVGRSDVPRCAVAWPRAGLCRHDLRRGSLTFGLAMHVSAAQRRSRLGCAGKPPFVACVLGKGNPCGGVGLRGAPRLLSIKLSRLSTKQIAPAYRTPIPKRSRAR